MLRLKKIGSIRETKKAPVLIVTRATETVDTLIAVKKKIQCKAIRIPVKKNLAIAIQSTLNDFLFTRKYRTIKTIAKDILYQTKGMASRLINAPRIAVKPQVKTIRCSSK
jgi:hypothetical protein